MFTRLSRVITLTMQPTLENCMVMSTILLSPCYQSQAKWVLNHFWKEQYFFLISIQSVWVRLTQSVEHQTFNLRVMGSSPVSSARTVFPQYFTFSLFVMELWLRISTGLKPKNSFFFPKSECFNWFYYKVYHHCLSGIPC